MKEVGVIKQISGNKASVTIKRHAACGDCGACAVGQEKMTMETVAYNAIGAKEGDAVEVEMQFVNVMQASMIAYGFPLLMFIAGAAIGYYPVNSFMGTPENPVTGFIAGMILTTATYAVIKLAEKKGLFSKGFEPQITNILDKDM
ncbi:SoxR reducing system RseC family protein [Alkalibacter saccharofermentans]|uniref:Positive regulator of sigma(E), RseC/MucC n=1 Tax=Alkalibacter saccharofermentans DSM 14828 TaxID=1120975 RepID=A0A1M4S4D2_9FIRM|nr:SoxR reducing system RseC family protein [Alkalibacter saccharofermentans]SHE27076.1 positive regulator of sigma(E), RseC/MucC [Alkalibacter saccharofermentans DSM 14828]